MKSNYKVLGQYIQPVVGRNNDLKDLPLMGLSIQKKFIPSIANTIGTDMTTYRVIEKKQFAFGPVTSRNGDKITIALFNDFEKGLISQAYIPFEVKDNNELDAEYLMMWFRRPEFDRYARFKSHGSAREIFDWEEMCDVTLPIPSIAKQREIVNEYNVIQERIQLNQSLIQKLEETAQAIYKQWFVDFEFPDENGKPYKRNGGEMEQLTKTTLSNYVVHSKQIINPSNFPEILFSHFSIPAFDETCLPKMELGIEILSNKYIAKNNSILISKLNPNFSRVWSLYGEVAKHSICSTEFQVLIPKNEISFGFVFFFLKSESAREFLMSMATGTSNSHQRVRPDNLLNMPMLYFDDAVIEKFNSITIPFIKLIKQKKDEILNLEKFKALLLSKIATIEN